MPNNARALTRAARERARATGETYTQAREAVLRIRERMAEPGTTKRPSAAGAGRSSAAHKKAAA